MGCARAAALAVVSQLVQYVMQLVYYRRGMGAGSGGLDDAPHARCWPGATGPAVAHHGPQPGPRAAVRTRGDDPAATRRPDRARQTLNAIELGKYSPTLEVAFRIAEVFGEPLERVFQHGPA